MMKTKCKKQEEDARDSEEPSTEQPLLQQECAVEDAPLQCAAIDVKLQPQNPPPPQPQGQTEEQQPVVNNSEDNRKAMEESLSPGRMRPRQQPQAQTEEQQPVVNNNENKRKAMEESLSPERTRPRYNGLTAVSNL